MQSDIHVSRILVRNSEEFPLLEFPFEFLLFSFSSKSKTVSRKSVSEGYAITAFDCVRVRFPQFMHLFIFQKYFTSLLKLQLWKNKNKHCLPLLV